MQPHLPEPEQVEVIDEERRDEHEEPAGAEEPEERGAPDWVLHLPHDAADRPPLPEEEKERDARGEHVDAALGGLGTMRVHQRLNPAAPSRCAAARTRSATGGRTTIAVPSGPSGAESIERGTPKPPTKPIA
jgi:hypothetical protein